MKAMVLAAGLGTRLRPLTDDRPKALVEVAGRTLLELTLARLRAFGIQEVIINTHHFADMIDAYLRSHGNFGMHIEISHEEVLLDTGGGLKKAASFFPDSDEPFLVHNVDVLSTIDFNQMLQFHKDHKCLATLAIQDRTTSRYLLFDEANQLCGRRTGLDGKSELVRPIAGTDAGLRLLRDSCPLSPHFFGHAGRRRLLHHPCVPAACRTKWRLYWGTVRTSTTGVI